MWRFLAGGNVMRSWVLSFVLIFATVGTACSKRPEQPPEQGKRTGAVPDKGAIAKFLTAYYKTSFADRGRYVLDPKEFENLQETYYKGARALIPDEIQTAVSSAKAGPKPDYLTVVATFNYTLGGNKATEVQEVYLVDTKDGLKFDWTANVGYNPTGFNAWAAGTDHTLTLRVEAKLTDFYNYHYSEARETHYSLSLQNKYGDRWDFFYGYVSKDSDLGRKLFEVVKDGQGHRLIVTVERTGREDFLCRDQATG